GSRPSLRDGLLGVVLVEPAAGLLSPLHVRSWQAEHFEVDAASPLNVGLDGESVRIDPPLSFRVRPGVLRVRLPVTAPGVSPAALRPRLGPTRLAELWSIARGVPPG
ncbi:MAG: diacylglycerol kinase, partial [Acidobacteria bacterium]|nr:diacylglycerol kinase [Acidobacteriota bacterium]